MSLARAACVAVGRFSATVGNRGLATEAGRIAFLGCGNMGMHMAGNLSKSGRDVVCFDPSAEALDKVATLGCSTAQSAKGAAEGASVVISMLPSNPHVLDTYCGADNVLDVLAPGALCIDSSTVDPAVSRKAAAEAEAKGHDLVDAPVSGGVGGAEAGTLTFMVGGTEAAFGRSEPVLNDMGANIVHCGAVGTGEIAKLCNNMVLAVSMIGVAEAMNVGAKLGIDPKMLASIMSTSTARCWSVDTYNPFPGVMDGVPASRNYEGGFGSALMLKDLGLVADAAKSIAAPIPLGASAKEFYQLLVANGLGQSDFGVAYKFLAGEAEEEK